MKLIAPSTRSNLNSASVTEIFPGRRHHIFGGETNGGIDQHNVTIPHLTELTLRQTAESSYSVGINERLVTAKFKYDVSGLRSIKRGSTLK
jgi:hypothetical protein